MKAVDAQAKFLIRKQLLCIHWEKKKLLALMRNFSVVKAFLHRPVAKASYIAILYNLLLSTVK